MTYNEFCKSIQEEIEKMRKPVIKREGIEITPELLDLYRDWMNNGWAPAYLMDADAIITENKWIDAMEELEKEGTALFLEFIRQVKKDRGI